MKLAVASDLHLEFGDVVLENTENADVLVLAGDICVVNHLNSQNKYRDRYLAFFERCSKTFPHTVLILGNHEFYHGSIGDSENDLRYALKPWANIHLLDNQTFVLDNVTFIGTTLWTDMNREDAITLFHMKSAMNDFRCIKNGHRAVSRIVPLYAKDEQGKCILDERGYMQQVGSKQKLEASAFTPEDSVAEHRKALGYIDTVTAERGDEKFVLVVHHCPSEQSVAPQYKSQVLMNGAFRSDLDEFILARPQIKLLCHGHTHEPFAYDIGTTQVICNPRGYIGHEQRANEFALKYVDLL